MLTLKKTLTRSLGYSLISLSLGYTLPALAGVDTSCSPSFDLSNTRSFDQCSNLPVFVPSNDNKTNMLLLLSDLGLAKLNPSTVVDQHIWSAVYAHVPFDADDILPRVQNKIANRRQTQIKSDEYIYDERCNNLSYAAQQFSAIVKNNRNMSAAEKQHLIDARNNIQSCEKTNNFISVDPQWSKTAQQYASYINASIAFYNANFSTATKIYSVLTQVEDPWLKETAQYMLIRSSLNSAFATGVDTYGDINLAKLDQSQIQQMLGHIEQYLKLYPQGQYVASAQGLLRRGYWLSGRQDLLINEIVWQMQHSNSPRYNLDMSALPAEIDRRIFQNERFNANQLNDPFLLAIHDLMQMRDLSDPDFKAISWSALNAQQVQFKSQPELFKYLQACHLYYVQNKAKEALNYLPNTQPDLNNYLALSQVFLKGQILEKIAPAQTIAYWTQLLKQSKNLDQRGLFEVALSKHLNAQQNYQAYLGKDALIQQINLQQDFIINAANADSLEKIVQSNAATTAQKHSALFVLLAKSLGHQNYARFNQYYPLMPQNAAAYKSWESENKKYQDQPPFAHLLWNGNRISPQLSCPDLKTLALALEKSPQDLTLKMCLGEYMRSEYAYSVMHHLNFEEKGKSTFDGPLYTRGHAYKEIIARKQKSELTAYALYRSVQCYAPSGLNDCQDQDVAKSTRKQWFEQLKRDYPETSWAKSLKYYW